MATIDGGDAYATYDDYVPIATPTAGLASGVTLMGRRAAENLMSSSCVIKRQTSTAPNANGVEVPVYSTIYTGKCRLRMPNAGSTANGVAAAGQALELQSPTLSLPVVGSELILPDDIVTIASPLDPQPITARISGVHSQTHSSARRFPIEVTN